MTARFLMLPVVFAALLLAGCENPKAEEPPQAKVEKTTAELLVGKWKLVKRTPPPRPFYPMTFEYTLDGKITLRKYPSGDRPWADEQIEVQLGTYCVKGNRLLRTMDTEPTERNVSIESITEDKLITSGFSGSTRMVHEYARIRGDF